MRSMAEEQLRLKKCKLGVLTAEIEILEKDIAFRKKEKKMLADLRKKEGRA